MQSLDSVANDVDEAWIREKRNRVADIDYILRWALPFGALHGKTCSNPRFVFLKEYNSSMISTITFECLTCSGLFQGKTEDPLQEQQIRRSLVVGSLLSGGTHGTTGELLAAADIPWISFKSFLKDEEELDGILERHVADSTTSAVEEEKSSVLSMSGELPGTTVYVDGCYGTRSYNNKYRSTSGGAVIIGYNSKKILYGATKSSYCLRCLLNKRRDTDHDHTCSKNFTGPAGRMEPAIIVEGLNHIYRLGLKALVIVGDGDCTSFEAAKDGTPYGDEIEKQNCRNHTTRNLRRHLMEVLTYIHYIPLRAKRKFSYRYMDQLSVTLQRTC